MINLKSTTPMLVTFLFAGVVHSSDCPDLSVDQLHTLQEAYDYGKEYNLEYTLAAIVLQESRAGEVLIGYNVGTDNDYGVAQINLKTASNMEGVRGSYGKGVLASKLVTDNEYNLGMAVEVLQWWQNYHKGDYNKMLMSYNAGHNVFAGVGYKDIVVVNVRSLRECINFE